MKKIKWIQMMAVASLLVLAAGCQEEPLKAGGGADCGGCEDIPPGGGTVVVYCPDLVVSAVGIDGIFNGNRIDYRVTIKNIGNKSVYLNPYDVSWQAYLSPDGISNTVAACGTGFSGITLAPGQTWTKSFQCYFPSSVNIWDYPYMIVHLKVQNIKECRSDNNTLVHRMF